MGMCVLGLSVSLRKKSDFDSSSNSDHMNHLRILTRCRIWFSGSWMGPWGSALPIVPRDVNATGLQNTVWLEKNLDWRYTHLYTRARAHTHPPSTFAGVLLWDNYNVSDSNFETTTIFSQVSRWTTAAAKCVYISFRWRQGIPRPSLLPSLLASVPLNVTNHVSGPFQEEISWRPPSLSVVHS